MKTQLLSLSLCLFSFLASGVLSAEARPPYWYRGYWRGPVVYRPYGGAEGAVVSDPGSDGAGPPSVPNDTQQIPQKCTACETALKEAQERIAQLKADLAEQSSSQLSASDRVFLDGLHQLQLLNDLPKEFSIGNHKTELKVNSEGKVYYHPQN